LRRSAAPRVKPAKEIQGEIQAIIRQITASVTFLPLLEEPCTFDLLVYADEAAAVPKAWEESDPRYVASGSTEVRLRSFTTTIHAVSATVVYKAS
jgi:mitotic spindle assembly checkpoint protein MAD2